MLYEAASRLRNSAFTEKAGIVLTHASAKFIVFAKKEDEPKNFSRRLSLASFNAPSFGEILATKSMTKYEKKINAINIGIKYLFKNL